MSRDLGARYPRRRVTHPIDNPAPVRKEDAPCCIARTDSLGRLPIGYCSPECIRRPKATA